jgi:translation initiation factor 2B subunit (eIF-2B alpha/beta/delta family)
MQKRFDKIMEDIKSVKIQGANNIALAGISAYLLSPNEESIKKILSTRPTEPLLQNCLNILNKSMDKKQTAKKLIAYIKESNEKIAKAGSKLIKEDMNVFSHCHSSSVMEILKLAKKQKKNFVVYTLEVEPLLQGRITAEELAKNGIKVIVFPDLAAEAVVRKCNLFLFGADAFLKKGVVNKLGTSLLAHLAKENNLPIYSCGDSLKYTKKVKIEKRAGKEVWDERSMNINVENPTFDLTKKKLLNGVISEYGILPYKDFIKKAKKTIKNF